MRFSRQGRRDRKYRFDRLSKFQEAAKMYVRSTKQQDSTGGLKQGLPVDAFGLTDTQRKAGR